MEISVSPAAADRIADICVLGEESTQVSASPLRERIKGEGVTLEGLGVGLRI
jgi:hypothetical protein